MNYKETLNEIAEAAKETGRFDIHKMDKLSRIINSLRRRMSREKEIIESGDVKKIRNFYVDSNPQEDEELLKWACTLLKSTVCELLGEFAAEALLNGCETIIPTVAAAGRFIMNRIDNGEYVDIRTCYTPMPKYKTNILVSLTKHGDMLEIGWGMHNNVCLSAMKSESSAEEERVWLSIDEESIGTITAEEVIDACGEEWAEYLIPILVKQTEDAAEDVVEEEEDECRSCEFFDKTTGECDKYLQERSRCTTPTPVINPDEIRKMVLEAFDEVFNRRSIPTYPLQEGCNFARERGNDYCKFCFYNESGVCTRRNW